MNIDHRLTPKLAPKPATPLGPGVAMEIVWAKVKGPKAVQFIQKLTAAYPRKDRHQRRAYNKLVLKAAKLGLLVRVPTQPVLEGKPVAPEALTKPG